MKRSLRIASLAVLAAALAPLHAGASVQVESLSLSPAQGTPGSAFTAVFDFAAAACSNWTVHFWWGPLGHQQLLGNATATGSPQSCQASLPSTVPGGAMGVPGQTYRVDAAGQMLGGTSVNGGNGYSGTAQFTVLGNPSQAGSNTNVSSGSSSQAGHAASSSTATDQAATTSTAAAAAATAPPPSSGVSGALSSGQDGQGQQRATPQTLAIITPSRGPSVPIGVWLGAALALAVAAGAAWVARARLPRLLRLPRR